jgi:hypothetical protein
MTMRRKFVLSSIALLSLFCPSARGDLFGGDVAVLSQILVNAIQQLSTLNSIMKTGGDTLGMVRDINKGINDSLNLIRTIDPNWNPGIYKDWENVQRAVSEVERIYGTVSPGTSETGIQKDVDQSVAEAVTLNNAIYDYTREIDRLGEDIKTASHTVSPGGAQKLTAETLGVMLHVMNSSLRTQATALKLQAEALGVQNRQAKAETKHRLASSNSIQKEFGRKAKFQIPRY